MSDVLDAKHPYFKYFLPEVSKGGGEDKHWLFASLSKPSEGYVPILNNFKALASLPSKGATDQKKAMTDRLQDFTRPDKGVLYGIGVCGARGAGAQVSTGLPADMLFMMIAAKKLQMMSGDERPVYCLIGDGIAKGNGHIAASADLQEQVKIAGDFYEKALTGIAEKLGIKNHVVIRAQDYENDPLYLQAREEADKMSPQELGIPDFESQGDDNYYRCQAATVWFLQQRHQFNTKVSWYSGDPGSIDETSFDHTQDLFNAHMKEAFPAIDAGKLHFVATRSGYSYHFENGAARSNVSPYYALSHQGGNDRRFTLFPAQSLKETFMAAVNQLGGGPAPGTKGLPANKLTRHGLNVLETLSHYLHEMMPEEGFGYSNPQEIEETLKSYGLPPEYKRTVSVCSNFERGVDNAFRPVLENAARQVEQKWGVTLASDCLGFMPPGGEASTAVPVNEPDRVAPGQGMAGREFALN